MRQPPRSCRAYFVLPLALLALAVGRAAAFTPTPAETNQSVPRVSPQYVLPNTHYDRGAFAFSADSRTVAVATTSGVNVWDVQTQTLQAVAARNDFFANSLAFSSDGRWLALGKNNGAVQLWDRTTTTLAASLAVTKWSIYEVAFSPDSRLLAVDAADGTVQVWNVAKQRRKWTLGNADEDKLVSLCFSHDGSMLATFSTSSASGKIALWDMATGQLRRTWGTDSTFGGSLAFSPDDETLLLGGSSLRTWNSRTGKLLQTKPLPDALQEKFDFTNKGIVDISRMEFLPQILPSPDGQAAASRLESGTIALWDVKTRAVLRLLGGETVSDLAGGGVEGPVFSPDGRWVAAMTGTGDLEIWSTQPDKPPHQVY